MFYTLFTLYCYVYLFILFKILYIKLYLFFTSVLANFDNGGHQRSQERLKKVKH